jgi:tetratricopeptide (TPR) repeat protein
LSALEQRLRWLLPAAVFLACWAVYLPTLNPAFRADDSPETTAAAYTLGIQHPPGYPLHTVIARVLMQVPLGAPAWRGNLFAALCGALACAFLASLLRSVAGAWLRAQGEDDEGRRAWLATATGAVAGLLLGLGTTFWPQSLSAKGGIYTLHLAFMAGSLLLLWRWGRDAEARPQAGVPELLRLPSARLLLFVLALGLGNHWETQALVLPAAALFVGLTLWPRLRTAARKPDGAAWARAALPLLGLAALGVSIYLYLPIRARLAPVLNWGDPKDWQQFWWVFLRQEYLDLETGFLKSVLAAATGGGTWSQAAADWAYVQRQGLRVLGHLFAPHPDLGLGAVALSALGVGAWRPQRDGLLGRFALALSALALGFVLVITFYFHLKAEMVWILDVFLLPAYLAQAAFAAIGGLWLWWRVAAAWPAWAALLLAASLLPVLGLLRAPQLSQARHFIAWDYGLDLLLSVKPQGIVLAEGDFNTMPIYYLQQVARRRLDVDHVTTVFMSTDWGVAHAKAVQPRLRIGSVPKAVTGARAGDGQVLRAALGQMAAANPGRPLHSSLFRQELDNSVPEWAPHWRPHGLAAQLNGPLGPAEDRARLGLLQALRSRHLEHDRARLDPSPAFALSNYGTVFMDMANWLRGQGRLAEALPLYRAAAQWTSRPNLAETYTHWGIALGAGGAAQAPDLEAATKKFEQALAVKPLFEAYANLAGVLNQRGQAGLAGAYAQAETAARQALGLRPDNAQAYNNLAIALYYQGRGPEAVQALREAARLAPQDAQIRANLRALGGG